MKNLMNRPLALFLSFLGFMIGFTSKVLAQYGAPVMHYKILGQVKAVECEQAIGGVEVTLVNDATGEIDRIRTDRDGNFSFRIIEYFWSSEYTMNIADIDGDHNGGLFESASFKFRPEELSPRNISYDYWEAGKDKTPKTFYLDYIGKNPCKEDTIITQAVLMPDTLPLVSDVVLPEETLLTDSFETNGQYEPEPELTDPVILFPNPNDGMFSVRFELQYAQEVEFRILTISGQLLERLFIELDEGRHTIPIDVRSISPQTIIVRLKINGRIVELRAVII
jgi:putative lipoprotein (rSAM/lipoprotein system)